jgi:predicted O-methyltransferase YrrM
MAGSVKFVLSPRVLAEPFWDVILMPSDEREPERERLLAQLAGLEALREKADYNTGSIWVSAAWCLYSLVRHFRLSRAIEVGTFIGKSTVAMAAAMDDGGHPGEIFTCDMSNSLDLPWAGQTKITQFKGQSSSAMLEKLEGTFDLVFLDGRIQPQEVGRLEQLLAPDAIIALDDFEGMEKGVANLFALRQSARFKSYALIYPCPRLLLDRRGFSSHSLTAVLVPASRFQIAAQG